MCGSHRWIIHTQVHWWISYIRAVHYVCGTPFQISGNVSNIRNLFMHLGLTVLQKHLTDDYRWIFFVELLCPTCVTGTWVPSWVDVILIWYHYIVICTFVTIFNWWLSSKDMKLWVLIKEVLVVFHWLTVRYIYIYIYHTCLKYVGKISEEAQNYK